MLYWLGGGGQISCGGFLLDFHKVGVRNEIDYREIINKSIQWGGGLEIEWKATSGYRQRRKTHKRKARKQADLDINANMDGENNTFDISTSDNWI